MKVIVGTRGRIIFELEVETVPREGELISRDRFLWRVTDVVHDAEGPGPSIRAVRVLVESLGPEVLPLEPIPRRQLGLGPPLPGDDRDDTC